MFCPGFHRVGPRPDWIGCINVYVCIRSMISMCVCVIFDGCFFSLIFTGCGGMVCFRMAAIWLVADPLPEKYAGHAGQYHHGVSMNIEKCERKHQVR